MITLYGIKNCDTMKKAMRWVEDMGHSYHFHDYRKDGLDKATLESFVEALGWEAVLNTRGTTWRKLDDADKADITKEKAVVLMLGNVAMIKRPIWHCDGRYAVGFAADDRDALKTILDL